MAKYQERELKRMRNRLESMYSYLGGKVETQEGKDEFTRIYKKIQEEIADIREKFKMVKRYQEDKDLIKEERTVLEVGKGMRQLRSNYD